MKTETRMKRVAVGLAAFLMWVACKGPEAPVATRIVALEYPGLARAVGIQGTIKVAAVTDENGNVQDVRPVEGEVLKEHSLLFTPVRENLLKWKFEKRQGDTSSRSVVLTYTFKIEGLTRGEKKQQFMFEQPASVFVTSEGACPDHLPCNEEEVRAWERDRAK